MGESFILRMRVDGKLTCGSLNIHGSPHGFVNLDFALQKLAHAIHGFFFSAVKIENFIRKF